MDESIRLSINGRTMSKTEQLTSGDVSFSSSLFCCDIASSLAASPLSSFFVACSWAKCCFKSFQVSWVSHSMHMRHKKSRCLAKFLICGCSFLKWFWTSSSVCAYSCCEQNLHLRQTRLVGMTISLDKRAEKSQTAWAWMQCRRISGKLMKQFFSSSNEQVLQRNATSECSSKTCPGVFILLQ